MSESSSSRRRGVWSHWIPLVVTVAVATAGIAAWALSQRNSSTDDEDEQAALAAQHESGLDYDNADYGDNPPYGASSIVMGNSGGEGKRQGGAGSISTGVDTGAPGERKGGASSGEAVKKWAPSVQEVLRRTPSPQQILSGAGKTVAAGVAGVAGAVGSALVGSSAKPAFDDHATWSEEADAKAKTKAADGARSGGKRKVVAVVVSADTKDTGYTDADGFHEHAVGFCGWYPPRA